MKGRAKLVPAVLTGVETLVPAVLSGVETAEGREAFNSAASNLKCRIYCALNGAAWNR